MKHLVYRDYEAEMRQTGDFVQVLEDIPVHCQFFFITGLYRPCLWQALHNFHGSIKLDIDKLLRIHSSQTKISKWDKQRV